MTRARRRKGAVLGLVGFGGYGLAVGVVGVLVALATTSAAAAPSLADGTLGRPIDAAPVVVPSVDAASSGSPSDSTPADPSGVDPSPAGASVPVASQGSVAPGQISPWTPDRLVLPSGRIAPVVAAGVLSDGALAIPADPKTVGWWTGGAMVGDPYGGIVLAGHVDSARLGLGVLADLRTARVGQLFVLRSGARIARYRIVSMHKVAQAHLVSGTDAFRQDVDERLVVITCGGPFDRQTHSYRDNLVVIAVPMP